MNFRPLRADEVECRIDSASEKGITLVLYKDARCDMKILDETVGAENWQREHYDCKGNLFCRVGIKCGEGWIWKADCGTESNVEKEKGEASDSFKRACVNWGIGRELYDAPWIFVPMIGDDGKPNYRFNDRGKPVGKFKVQYLRIENDKVIALAIDNLSLHRSVFTFEDCFPEETKEPLPQVKKKPIPKYIGSAEQEEILSELHRTGWNPKEMMQYLGKKFPDMPPADLGTITDEQYRFILGALKKKPTKE